MNQSQAIIENLLESQTIDIKAKTFSNDGKILPVLFDPRLGVLMAFGKQTKDGIRILVGRKHMVVWDANLATHHQVAQSVDLKDRDKWIEDATAVDGFSLFLRFLPIKKALFGVQDGKPAVLDSILAEHPPKQGDIPVIRQDHTPTFLASPVLKKVFSNAEFLVVGEIKGAGHRIIYFTKGWNPIEIVWNSATRTWSADPPLKKAA